MFRGLSLLPPPGPLIPDSSSQVFPAYAALATVFKDNTLCWISAGRFNASAAYAQHDPLWGGCRASCVTVLALIRSGPSSRIIPHNQQDKRINIMRFCPQMLTRLKLLENSKLRGWDDFQKVLHRTYFLFCRPNDSLFLFDRSLL